MFEKVYIKKYNTISTKILRFAVFARRTCLSADKNHGKHFTTKRTG